MSSVSSLCAQRKALLRGLLVVFYALAGVNHFVNPAFYIPLIPPYFPFPEAINLVAGVAEVVLAVGVAVPRTRRLAAVGIVLMLLAFVPSHVYFVQTDGCVGAESLCVPLWVGWVRLVVVHPLLIAWAWYVRA